jgi:predicted nucleic acid-binding protein
VSAREDVHLDTSFLIRALVRGSAESDRLREWLRSGRSVAISSLAWGELLCGPIDEATAELVRRVVPMHVPIGSLEAERAARLFNGTGRRRGSFQDCLVAATALETGAMVATVDCGDFGRFREMGLEIAS